VRAHQHLCVEAEPERLERAETGVRGLGGEQLEAALRVADSRQHEQAQDAVVAAAHELAPAGLVDLDVAAGHVARGDRDVAGAAEVRAQAGQLLDRSAQIGIAERAQFAASAQHAGTHRRALALVRGQAQYLKLWPLTRRRLRHRDRVVAAAVVHDDHLIGLVRPVEVLADALQGGRQAASLVVGRDDHGEVDRAGPMEPGG